MSEPNWTKEQLDVISLRGRNILVSAAAGSGKTAVLVERIITKITTDDPPCDIDKLLVVTFTRAAASEMRSRIGSALEERLQREPENEHIARQASLLHSAQITTIDSFCQWILKNYFHVIDLDPVYRVGDETELLLMKQELLEELLEEKYLRAREDSDEAFLNFTNIFSPGRTDKNIEDVILTLYEKSMSYPYPEEWIRGAGEIYSSTTVEELEECRWVQELLAYVKKCAGGYLHMAEKAGELCRQDDGPMPYLEAVQADIAFLQKLEDVQSFTDCAQLMAGFEAMKLKAIRGKESTVSPEKKERVKSLREGYLKKGIQELQKKYFFQSLEDALEDLTQMREPVQELISLTLEFGEVFSEKKREEQILDFSDMEHFALEILTERDERGQTVPSETARELQQYFDEIMTDEYQDSNEVQELLLTSLCGEEGKKPYLFMVGDVKQSIYKFRMAEPEIFLHKYKTFSLEESGNQRIDLKRNFRSRADVLESANWIFEKLMQEDLGGIAYDEAARLVPGAEFHECEYPTGGRTELVLIEQKSDDISLDKKSLEAAVIGRKIRKLVQGENPFYVQDKHGYRPVTYGDIVILLRSVTGWAEEYVNVLSDMGIPAYADTRTGYFTSLEVETILNFLHIIDNPRQDIPLAAVLRSYLGELTDEEMAWIGTMEDDINYWDKAEAYRERGEDPVLREKLSRFFERLESYRIYAGTHSVYELLHRIYDETGYYQYMSAMPSGEKRRANLDILLQQSLEFARNGHRGIYGFARYIESLRKSEVDFGEAAVDGENANTVRIMTIHKSKGLEFPVVFVAGMGKQFNMMDARKGTVIDSDFGVGCDFVDLDLRLKRPTLAKKFIASQVVLSTLAEEIRVLYVAFTRAKERLIISGTVSNLEKKLNMWEENADNVQFSSLASAQTYLDWITPVILGRNLNWTKSASLESCGIAQRGEDDYFRLETYYPKDTVAAEAHEQEKDLSLYRELQELDTTDVFDEKMRETLDSRNSFRYPYLSEAELPVKISVSELKRQSLARAEELEQAEAAPLTTISEIKSFKDPEVDAGEEIPRPVFLQDKKEISGTARGTLYHKVMEHFPYEQIRKSGGEWSVRDFENYLTEMAAGGYMTDKEREVLDCRKFTVFQASDIGRRMADAQREGKLRLEQPFMMGVPARDIYSGQDSDAKVMVQGIIDAFFYQGEDIVLVDYKTDFVKRGQEEELAKKYAVQLSYYAEAIERLTGHRVAERIIYSFSLGKEIQV